MPVSDDTHTHTQTDSHTHTNIVGIINNIAKLINFSIWKTSAPFARFGVLRPTPRGIFAISGTGCMVGAYSPTIRGL